MPGNEFDHSANQELPFDAIDHLVDTGAADYFTARQMKADGPDETAIVAKPVSQSSPHVPRIRPPKKASRIGGSSRDFESDSGRDPEWNPDAPLVDPAVVAEVKAGQGFRAAKLVGEVTMMHSLRRKAAGDARQELALTRKWLDKHQD